MGHKYHSDTGAKIESITYTPGIQESSDLEAATRNISSFVEPGSPDYNTTLVAPTPDDDRLQVLRIAVRLQATVDSWAESGTVLNYRIKRNGLSVGTGTLTDAGATGDLFIAHDITEPAGNLTGPSSYDIFLWVNTGSCVISVVKVWGGVGTVNSSSSAAILLTNHTGVIFVTCFHYRGAGTGDHYGGISRSSTDINSGMYTFTSGNSWLTLLNTLVINPTYFLMWGSVPTDIHAIQEITLVLNGA